MSLINKLTYLNQSINWLIKYNLIKMNKTKWQLRLLKWNKTKFTKRHHEKSTPNEENISILSNQRKNDDVTAMTCCRGGMTSY